jgi:hypothetical protein
MIDGVHKLDHGFAAIAASSWETSHFILTSIYILELFFRKLVQHIPCAHVALVERNSGVGYVKL